MPAKWWQRTEEKALGLPPNRALLAKARGLAMAGWLAGGVSLWLVDRGLSLLVQMESVILGLLAYLFALVYVDWRGY